MNDWDYWRWMIKFIEDERLRFIEGEWLRLSIRFTEDEWLRLLKMND
jgi:hypothetical protein